MKTTSKLAAIASVAVVAASLASVVVGQRSNATRGSAQVSKSQITAENCLVALVEERNVPAEEAGVLVRTNVREGDRVAAFERRTPRLKPKSLDAPGTVYPEDSILPLAEIDKSLPLLQKQVAAKEYLKADGNYQNDVSVRYASKQADVAKTNYYKGLAVNDKNPGSISEMEILQRKLEWDAGILRIEQAEHDRNQAQLDANVKEAELANAEQAMDHRDIHSPIDGVVVQIYVHQGEWVRPGDPVFRIINLQKLRVQANLNIAECDPRSVRGREVTVTSTITDVNGDNRDESFTGRVVFVNPEVKSGGRFSVWAEVDNRQTPTGEYILWPGMKSNMVVDLTSTPKVNENATLRRAAQ
ncbi:MAG: efflux RND transporter periplasmic adaptor subunit [Pirellulales bacterium]